VRYKRALKSIGVSSRSGGLGELQAQFSAQLLL